MLVVYVFGGTAEKNINAWGNSRRDLEGHVIGHVNLQPPDNDFSDFIPLHCGQGATDYSEIILLVFPANNVPAETQGQDPGHTTKVPLALPVCCKLISPKIHQQTHIKRFVARNKQNFS